MQYLFFVVLTPKVLHFWLIFNLFFVDSFKIRWLRSFYIMFILEALIIFCYIFGNSKDIPQSLTFFWSELMFHCQSQKTLEKFLN